MRLSIQLEKNDKKLPIEYRQNIMSLFKRAYEISSKDFFEKQFDKRENLVKTL